MHFLYIRLFLWIFCGNRHRSNQLHDFNAWKWNQPDSRGCAIRFRGFVAYECLLRAPTRPPATQANCNELHFCNYTTSTLLFSFCVTLAFGTCLLVSFAANRLKSALSERVNLIAFCCRSICRLSMTWQVTFVLSEVYNWKFPSSTARGRTSDSRVGYF